jgi:hypothetical protein
MAKGAFETKGKVKAIRQIENGEKSDVFRELGLVNSTIQTIWKTEPK